MANDRSEIYIIQNLLGMNCHFCVQRRLSGKPAAQSGSRRVEVRMVPTEHACPACHSPMVLRHGRRGPFLACSAYSKCRIARAIDAEGRRIEPPDTRTVCERCGRSMAIGRGPRGGFLACTGYPRCRWTRSLQGGG